MTTKKSFNLNNKTWRVRLPIKWAIFTLATLAVCFPSPVIFVQHIRHWLDPNALIEPDAAVLDSMKKTLQARLMDDSTDENTLKVVESLVLEQVPYDWDWNTWGTADYMPTVTEVIEMGREDCDGRAVVAASLLKHLGYDAQIVSDLSHVWVKTEAGELMGPGGAKAIEATDSGLKFNFSALLSLPKAFAYGIAVFPLVREIILAIVLWSLFRHRRKGFFYDVLALGLLVGALVLLRFGGHDYRMPVLWLQWAGMLAFFLSLGMMIIGSMYWKMSDETTAM